MPPQPGMFPIHSNKMRSDMYANIQEPSTGYQHHNAIAGPSRTHGSSDDLKKDRKRKDPPGKLGREMTERKDDSRYFQEAIQAQLNVAHQLSTRPETCPAYTLRLYPISLERSALLAQIAVEEKLALESVRIGYEEERDKVEDEWKRGRERIRERLLEGIEERRRRAREEKDGEGIGDATLDSQVRSHITRKLRNKMSPPPTPTNQGTAGTTAMGTVTNPLSLSIDELPSPFSLPLTATVPLANGTASGNGRRRAKGGGAQVQAIGGLGKSLAMLGQCKESEIEGDLGEIRRGNKRRRATAAAMGKT